MTSPYGRTRVQKLMRRFSRPTGGGVARSRGLASRVHSHPGLRPGRTWRTVAAAVALSAGSSRAAPGGVNGAIAFHYGSGICLVNPDGSGLTEIAGTSGGTRPRWSPDGSSLTFMMSEDIWTVDPDGSNLADHGPGDFDHSADGSSIY